MSVLGPQNWPMDVEQIETNLSLRTPPTHVPMEGLDFGSALLRDGYALSASSAQDSTLWTEYSKVITDNTTARVEVRPVEGQGTEFTVSLETPCLDQVEHAPLREWKEMLVSVVESLERLGHSTLSTRPIHDLS